jgi:hypothetical protein
MAHPNNPYVRTAAALPAPRAAAPQRNAPPPMNLRRNASREGTAMAGSNGEFNPNAFGGRSNGAPVASQNRMFNRAGQVNAWDRRDALTQIAYLLQNVTRTAGMKDFQRGGEAPMDKQARLHVLAAALQDPTGEGFAIVGQELLLPIKDIVDYEGWARKVYRTRPLAQGELFRIAKDVRATAWIVGQDGQSIESRLYGRYIQPSEFKVTSFPTVDIEDIYQMN